MFEITGTLKLILDEQTFGSGFNKREFVARCLSTICGKSDTESYQIMMQAHNNGYACLSYPICFCKNKFSSSAILVL